MNTERGSWDALSDESYLKTRPSALGKGSLSYIICEDIPPGWAPVSREDRLIYSAPLTGPFYAADNNSTYRIVEKWTIGSEAFIYVRPFKDSQDGCGAMQSLRLHYNGPGT
eukprot:9004582-Ditylum_brightwellii.AAC.1